MVEKDVRIYLKKPAKLPTYVSLKIAFFKSSVQSLCLVREMQ